MTPGDLVRAALAICSLPARIVRRRVESEPLFDPPPDVSGGPRGWLSAGELPDGRLLVRVFGVVDLRSAGDLAARLGRAMDAHDVVCVDLGELVDLDLAGVELITALPRLAHEHKCQLQLRQAPRHLQHIIELADPKRRLPFALWH